MVIHENTSQREIVQNASLCVRVSTVAGRRGETDTEAGARSGMPGRRVDRNRSRAAGGDSADVHRGVDGIGVVLTICAESFTIR